MKHRILIGLGLLAFAVGLVGAVTNLNFIAQSGISIHQTNNAAGGSLDVAISNTFGLTFRTNGVNLGVVDTINWTTGVTGSLSGTIATVGISASGGGAGGPTTSNNIPAALSFSGTNVVINADGGTVFRLILTTNALFTITGGSDAETITLQLTQGGLGNCAAYFTNSFWFGSDITAVTLSTNLGKTDYVKCQYWAASNRWDVLGFVRGY